MARAPFQVHVLPYRFSGTEIEYAIFKRADAGYWQGIAGGGETGETPLEAAKRETLNRETWRLAFLDRDSVLWWMIKTFHRKRRDYRVLFEQNRGDHLACIELRTQRQIDEFLHSLKGTATK